MPFLAKIYHDEDIERIIFPPHAQNGGYLRRRWQRERHRNSLDGLFTQFCATIYAERQRTNVSWNDFRAWHVEGRPLMPGR